MLSLHNLVDGWGGFEQFVAKLHETGTVDVQHDVTLTGKSGAPRQIDVLIKHREGLYEHLIIVECKYWKNNVSRLHVDALITAVNDLNAARGVIFSVKNFQEGAITVAKYYGIDLFKVRQLADIEWGSPGQIVDFYLQSFLRSIGNIRFPDLRAIGVPNSSVELNIRLMENGDTSSTPTLKLDGSPGETLEDILLSTSVKVLRKFTENYFILNNGEDCTCYMVPQVDAVPEPNIPFRVPWGHGLLIIPKITFDLGIKIQQTRLRHDRAERLIFALAVENCIKDHVTVATRAEDNQHTILIALNPADADAFQNNSILRIFLKGFFPFEELDSLTPVPIELF
jgi:hypothetical protein